MRLQWIKHAKVVISVYPGNYEIMSEMRRCQWTQTEMEEIPSFLQTNSLAMSVPSFALELKEVSFNCEKNQVILSAVFWVRGLWELFWDWLKCVVIRRCYGATWGHVMTEYIFYTFQSSFGSCAVRLNDNDVNQIVLCRAKAFQTWSPVWHKKWPKMMRALPTEPK